MGTGQGHGLNDPFEPCEKTSCGYCEREILEEEIPEENKSMPRTNGWRPSRTRGVSDSHRRVGILVYGVESWTA